jgi:Zn-dependent protease with chaperone function
LALSVQWIAEPVSTQFFERQDAQRSYTRWLVVGFIAAILAVVALIDLIVIVGFNLSPSNTLREHPQIIVWVSVLVIAVILVSSWHKSSQLRHGGGVVARSVGGVHVLSNDADFARQRLLNVVEEMAIAARVRKPQVFVLPDEPGINAFAAGHSPDEAAIAVTQGALDRLDRDQLQAVIGHEFSHILNGDMKINMRLTAFIFGLFVLTDLALRFMSHRGRGKRDARIYLIALGVFVVGSIGMLAGRLLQAGVSRRREHLADASAVQFTRNPQALQGAFVAMAAHAEGTRLMSAGGPDVAHMLIAGSDPSWANNFGGSWWATHPPLEERVRALDARISPNKFRTLVSDEKRRFAAKQSQASAPAAAATAPAPLAGAAASSVAAPAAPVVAAAAAIAQTESFAPGTVSLPGDAESLPAETAGLRLMATAELRIPAKLQETMPSGIRRVGGRALPPDSLRDRLTPEQQASITSFVTEVEPSLIDVQAAFVAAMLATEPAKWRMQLTRLAPVLGIELMKATQAQVARFARLTPAARLPALIDLLSLLDNLEPGDRKRLRAVARGFAPTVAPGDMLRYVVTRMLEKRLTKAAAEATPVPLTERAAEICTLYAALAQCRFGTDKQGSNCSRAGVMGMLPPKSWAPYPEVLATPATLDAAIAALDQIHPTGKRSFSDGLVRVIAVGGQLTVPQVDLLRGVCLLIDCPVPLIPADVGYEEPEAAPRASQASAR